MTEGDAGPIDVEVGEISYAQLLDDAEGLRGECFVQLDQVHVGETETGLGQHLPHGVDRPKTHVGGMDARDRPRPHVAERLQPERVSSLFGHHDTGRGPVVHPRRVAGCDGVAADRLQGGEAFRGRIRAGMLVPVEHFGAFLRPHREWHDLMVELARFYRGPAVLLAA
jgi:hypothetical protein